MYFNFFVFRHFSTTYLTTMTPPKNWGHVIFFLQNFMRNSLVSFFLLLGEVVRSYIHPNTCLIRHFCRAYSRDVIGKRMARAIFSAHTPSLGYGPLFFYQNIPILGLFTNKNCQITLDDFLKTHDKKSDVRLGEQENRCTVIFVGVCELVAVCFEATAQKSWR